MQFAKHIDANTIQLCPMKGRSVSTNNDHTNLPRFYEKNPTAAAADGYLAYSTSPLPEPRVGYINVATYSVENGEIIQTWTQTEAPVTVDINELAQTVESHGERLDIDEGALMEVSEILYV